MSPSFRGFCRGRSSASSIEAASEAEVTHAIDAAHDMLDGQGDGHTALTELEAFLLGQTSSRQRAGHRYLRMIYGGSPIRSRLRRRWFERRRAMV